MRSALFCTFVVISGLYTSRHWLSYLHGVKRAPFCVTKRRVSYSLGYNHDVHSSKAIWCVKAICASHVFLMRLILIKQNTPTTEKVLRINNMKFPDMWWKYLAGCYDQNTYNLLACWVDFYVNKSIIIIIIIIIITFLKKLLLKFVRYNFMVSHRGHHIVLISKTWASAMMLLPIAGN
jgi:hypothetical protein